MINKLHQTAASRLRVIFAAARENPDARSRRKPSSKVNRRELADLGEAAALLAVALVALFVVVSGVLSVVLTHRIAYLLRFDATVKEMILARAEIDFRAPLRSPPTRSRPTPMKSWHAAALVRRPSLSTRPTCILATTACR
jgi:hypothetical protein